MFERILVLLDGSELSELALPCTEKLADTEAVVKVEVAAGHGAQGIIKFADEKGISLVAMSTHGQSGIRRWFFGSTTYKVLHAGHTPLLLVKVAETKA